MSDTIQSEPTNSKLENFVRLDQIAAEMNEHQKAIAFADRVVEARMKQFVRELEIWRAQTIEPHQNEIARLEPEARDIVTRLIKGSQKKSVKLPHGTIGFRKAAPIFSFAGEKVTAQNRAFVEKCIEDKSEFVSFVPKLDWAGMKKTLIIVDNAVCKTDGEVVEGLSATIPPDNFFCIERGD